MGGTNRKNINFVKAVNLAMHDALTADPSSSSAEGGDLLAAQAAGTPTASAGQSDILGLQRLAPGAQEIGKLSAVHAPATLSERA
jgi:hypothetical protein